MKHLITLSLFLCLGITSNSQDYIPFPLENTAWFNGRYECDEFYNDCFFWGPTGFFTDDDTLINGNVMKKLFIDAELAWDSPEQFALDNYMGAIRADSSEVFFVPWYQEEERILYDFTLNVGDTIQPFSWWIDPVLVVENVTYDEIDGFLRKVIDFGNGKRWYEGLGSSFGIFVPLIAGFSGISYHLECVRNNGQIIFDREYGDYDCSVLSVEDHEREISIYPNPNNGRFKIEGIRGNAFVELLDYSGRVVGRSRLISANEEITFQDHSPAAGFYLIRISANDQTSMVRIAIH